jgi:hypothetical protein
MTDAQIEERIGRERNRFLRNAFPGTQIPDELSRDVPAALAHAGGAFGVYHGPLLVPASLEGLADPEAPLVEVPFAVATCRDDTHAPIGITGRGYGIVQTAEATLPLEAMAAAGDLKIVSVEVRDGGGRITLTCLLGVSSFPSLKGAPNTIAHFAQFVISHNGRANVVAVWSLRLECFNGMTSREVAQVHKLRHTSGAADRVEAFAETVLEELVGDVEAEAAIFHALAQEAMNSLQFKFFATELLGGPIPVEATPARKTRRENEVRELTEYFEGGCQGAGATAWGAYNSVTRWLEAQRERKTTAVAAAAKFESNTSGDGQRKIQRALRLLQN